jgi:rare lipoprotein A
MITRNYTPLFIVLLCSLLCFSSCSRKITENGKASYYADKFEGRRTASGETYHKNGLTAAHRTLPFGTKVKVLNISNGKSVTVRINDRGPFSQGRVIDLSKKAAKRIGILTTGVAVVEIKYKKKKK